jgi:hypothetical protein
MNQTALQSNSQPVPQRFKTSMGLPESTGLLMFRVCFFSLATITSVVSARRKKNRKTILYMVVIFCTTKLSSLTAPEKTEVTNDSFHVTKPGMGRPAAAYQSPVFCFLPPLPLALLLAPWKYEPWKQPRCRRSPLRSTKPSVIISSSCNSRKMAWPPR